MRSLVKGKKKKREEKTRVQYENTFNNNRTAACVEAASFTVE